MLPTITHIHMSVIPLLAASGTIFLDARAHKTIYDGCQVAARARRRRARFRFEDPDHLDELLRAERDRTRLVCMDGVNSMTGNAPDLRAFAASPASTARCSTSTTRTASASSASARPTSRRPYGTPRQQRRAPLRRELRRPRARRRLLQGLLVAAGVHRLPDRGQAPAQGRRAARTCTPARRRSPRWPPCSPASTSTSAAATRCAPSCTRLTAPRARRARRASTSTRRTAPGFPIIEIPLRDHTRIDEVGRFLFERGVYVTLAAYPLVPKDEVGFRVQLTAANTDAEVDRADRRARGARRARRAAAAPRRRRADRTAA